MVTVNRQLTLTQNYLEVRKKELGLPVQNPAPATPAKQLEINLNPFLDSLKVIPENLRQSSINPTESGITQLFDRIMEQVNSPQTPAFDTLKIVLGDQTLEIPAKKLTKDYLFSALEKSFQKLQSAHHSATAEKLQQTAEPVMAQIRPVKKAAKGKEAEQQAIQELTHLSLGQVTPANFTHLSKLLATYNQSKLKPKPPLSPALVANLETLFLVQAAQKPPAEQLRLMSMLPGIDATDLQLVKARGSLGVLGQLKASQGDISHLPKALRQTLMNQVNESLKMSGSSFRVQGLKDSELKQAVQQLEAQLGLKVTGQVTVENLREIEKAQKNLYVMITNVRNILHDEVLPEGTDKAKALESLVGKGGAINQKEALGHIQALRQKYFWLTDKKIPTDKFSLDLYFDTMKARQSWLTESRSTMGQNHLFTLKEAFTVQHLLEKQGGQASFSQLQTIVGDTDHFTLRERAAVLKLLQNKNLYNYVWSIEVGDKNKDGQLDGALRPPARNQTNLTVSKLKQFEIALTQENVTLSGGEKVRGVHIPEFYDGREAAAKIYDAGKVSGDEWFAWTGMGMGTNETAIKSTLQNSQEARGKLIALKRDYERLYQTELSEDVKGELSGGDLGEALTYVASPGEDMIASQQIGSAQRAEILLAKFKPQIDQIGADNGPIAWAVGHSSADHTRQKELLGLYGKAQQALAKWKANPKDGQSEKEVMALTSKVLIRLEADQQADIYYTQSKDEAVAVAKNVAIVAAATVVTVATGGAGAPLLVAVAAGTAAGTAVAFTGEAASQLGDYIGDSTRNTIATTVAQEQQKAVKQVSGGDDAFKAQILGDLDATLKGLQQDQANRKVFDRDKLLSATWEGFKTALVTSAITAATMGLNQVASSAKMQAAFATIGKSGNLTRMALINGISGAAGDAVGKIISPLHLNNTSSPAKVAEVLGQMEKHLADNGQLLKEMEKQKINLQAQVSAFYQKYQPAAQPLDKSITQIQTVKLEPPTDAEVKALFTAQVQLQEIQQNVKDLTESNKLVKDDIQKIKQNAGSLLTWNAAEWNSISEHLGRNLAIAFVSGAALNLVGGKTLATRIAFNSASSVVQTVGHNALEKYVDGKANKDLFDGVIQGVLNTIIVGEAVNAIQSRQATRQSLDSTLEGRAYQNLKADKSPENQQMLELLKEQGFKAEDPSTHAKAFAEVAQQHPEYRTRIETSLDTQRQIVFRDVSDQVAQQIRKSQPKADAETTVARFWEAQEQIAQLEVQKKAVQQEPASPQQVDKLGQLEGQQRVLQEQVLAIQKGEMAFNQKGQQLDKAGAMVEDVSPASPVRGEAQTAALKGSGTTQPISHVAMKEQVSRLGSMAEARGDVVGQQKLNQLLTDTSMGLSETLKADFLMQVEARLSDPANTGKSIHDIMQAVVADDAKTAKKFTLQGDQIPLDALQAGGTISRALNLKSVYKRHLTAEAKELLKSEYGITSPESFAQALQKNPAIFNKNMLDMNTALAGTNEVGWWSPVGQSKAETMGDLKQELALDEKFYEGGAIRISIEPKTAFALGIRKPTPMDGVPFKEWVDAPPDSAMGKTAGGKAEAVLPPTPLGKADEIRLFVWAPPDPKT